MSALPTGCNFTIRAASSNNSAGPIYFGRAVLGADLGGSVSTSSSYAGNVGSALSFFEISELISSVVAPAGRHESMRACCMTELVGETVVVN
jgi:hypothetical protein